MFWILLSKLCVVSFASEMSVPGVGKRRFKYCMVYCKMSAHCSRNVQTNKQIRAGFPSPVGNIFSRPVRMNYTLFIGDYT